jgi:glucosamine--fructose-6-phosphate aminotransferase (isomerizing)
MCGIFGILGDSPVAGTIVDGLRRLEYRGYDSAGVATLEGDTLARLCAEGKLANLEAKLQSHHLAGAIGIGHTRWATHGRPSEANAHPHATSHVAVVHNGIIENFRELRLELEERGCKFSSETDTEVVAHLVDEELRDGRAPADAVAKVLPRLRGTFALTFLFANHPDLLIAARSGSPLALGYGRGQIYVGSDAIALAPYVDSITYLDDGDWALIQRPGVDFYSSTGARVSRVTTKAPTSVHDVGKGPYRHFMAKEIHEQPEVVSHTLAQYIDFTTDRVRLPQALPFDFSKVNRLSISACGTAFYAGLVSKYWFERFARLPVEIDIASEFRYREAPMLAGDAALFVSQSGETADTLAILRQAKSQGQHILSVVNVPTSTIARESDQVLPMLAGPEIGVASTKAFTCQLAVLACLAIYAGKERGFLSEKQEQALVREIAEIPRLLNAALALEDVIKNVAKEMVSATDAIFLGRGLSFPLAMEGALKLKEISYIHAEGYAAGELKHGPIALVHNDLPVVVIAPHDRIFEKTASNVHEVLARGGKVVLLSDGRGIGEVGLQKITPLMMPSMGENFAPIVYAVPLQLLAYHVALARGADIDKPRNLAKSVTVE